MRGGNAVALVADGDRETFPCSADRAVTFTVVAGLAYLIALSIRFWNTMVSSS